MPAVPPEDTEKRDARGDARRHDPTDPADDDRRRLDQPKQRADVEFAGVESLMRRRRFTDEPFDPGRHVRDANDVIVAKQIGRAVEHVFRPRRARSIEPFGARRDRANDRNRFLSRHARERRQIPRRRAHAETPLHCADDRALPQVARPVPDREQSRPRRPRRPAARGLPLEVARLRPQRRCRVHEPHRQIVVQFRPRGRDVCGRLRGKRAHERALIDVVAQAPHAVDDHCRRRARAADRYHFTT